MTQPVKVLAAEFNNQIPSSVSAGEKERTNAHRLSSDFSTHKEEAHNAINKLTYLIDVLKIC